ncbi:MAG: shikimate kinase [Flavobacteriaceae bacterium]|nr:MAG: shikimate kinase [Flavobacteriaceae bacterium]
MRIVLIGYMGSGKSTVGTLLSKELGYDFLDLDAYIEEAMGTTISNMFVEKGEIFFRKKEHFFLKKIFEEKNDFILSTGGGTPCYSGNMETMVAETKEVFYLKVSIAGLVDRLYKEKDDRPLIKDLSPSELPEFIGKHLFERNHFYAQAHHTIICDAKSPQEIVEEIKKKLA